MGTRQNDYPPYMHDDGDRGGFVVRNPVSGKKKRFSADEEAQARKVAQLLGEWVKRERQLEALESGRPTIGSLVNSWKDNKLQFMPWSPSTRDNMVAKMNRIERELGTRIVDRTDCMFIEEWIGAFTKTADTFNDWRYVFILLWSFAVSRKLARENEPEKIEMRSTSVKLEMNRKQRQPLDIDGYNVIYEKAEPWLQLAMDTSLITLQGRSEVCNMELVHFRDDFLFVIRDKTSADSDMAFIKIALTPNVLELRERSLALDPPKEANVKRLHPLCPYLIHRAPAQMRRQWIDEKVKPHWRYVTPDYLTKAFAEVRDTIERFSSMDASARPSFHEIRGLGSRLYEERGTERKDITALMTHSNPKVTKIYLDGGRKALKDSDFVAVSAPLTVAQLLKKG